MSILKKAKEILATPEKWTRRALARDAATREVDVFDEKAVCWCLQGAIHKARGHFHDDDSYWSPEYDLVLDAVRDLSRYSGVGSFNDNKDTTFEDIHKILDMAIAKDTQSP